MVTFLMFLMGCAAVDSALSRRGKLETEISAFDQTKVVRTSPALTASGWKNAAEFGLYWDSKKDDEAHLIVQLDEATNFDPRSPLQLKIDGEAINLNPVSERDYGEVSFDSLMKRNVTQKSYFINKEYILKIANGKQGAYRINLLNQKYTEGNIDYQYQDFTTFIPDPFRRFYSEIWGTQ